jgi:hypothetical protein
LTTQACLTVYGLISHLMLCWSQHGWRDLWLGDLLIQVWLLYINNCKYFILINKTKLMSDIFSSYKKKRIFDNSYGTNWYEIFYDRTRVMGPFNAGDYLIEVTTWAGLTVYTMYIYINYKVLLLREIMFYKLKTV